MPTIDRPQTKPESKPETKPQSKPSKPSAPGQGVPKNLPQTKPQPKPQISPSPIAAAMVASQVDAYFGVCEIGVNVRAKRKFPVKDRDKGPFRRKRQRPCLRGGKPKVSYEWGEKKRIGSFRLAKSKVANVLGRERKPRVEFWTNQTARNAGYKIVKTDSPVRITSELAKQLPKDADWKERFRDGLAIAAGGGKKDTCLYLVFAQERKRKCVCPDGSKCRKTSLKRQHPA